MCVGGYLAARLTYPGDGHGRDAVKRLTLVMVMVGMQEDDTLVMVMVGMQ